MTTWFDKSLVTPSGGGTIATLADHFGNIAASLALKAPIASPTFTGVVTAPTFVGALTGTATSAVALAAGGADRIKLDGIATGATANATDAFLLARANHTGTQLVASISNLGSGSVTATGGTAARALSDRFSDVLNVRDFGTVGNGVASDQTAVAAAVAAAAAAGGALYWPDGTYLTTASIPSFHSVVHTGPGVVKRGSDLYRITPQSAEMNIIYVAATGNNANDGLSASQPIQTLAQLKAVLTNTAAEARGGVWRVQFAAGTYSDSTNFVDLPKFSDQLQFIGTGTSRTPTTIFDGTGVPYQTAGMYFQNGMHVKLQYIKFQDFVSGYGAYAQWNSKMEVYDCDAENCLIGYAASHSSYLRCERTLSHNCGDGYRVAYNSQASIGPGSGGPLADSARATSCTNGCQVSRGAIAHVDYCEFWDCTRGLALTLAARAAVLGTDFQRCGTAVAAWSSSEISQSASEPILFHQSDAVNRNTRTFQFLGGARDNGWYGQGAQGSHRFYRSTTPVTVSGTTALTVAKSSLFTAPAGYLVDDGVKMRIVVHGAIASAPVGGTTDLILRGATTALCRGTTVAGGNGSFRFEGNLYFTGSATQKSVGVVTMDGQSSTIVTDADTMDFLAADRTFDFAVDVNGDPGPTTVVTIETVEVYMEG